MGWLQPVAGESIFVRRDGWEPEGALPQAAVPGLLRGVKRRDTCLLAMLAQHQYLTTGHLASLFFPSRRMAQHRLAQLSTWGLVIRWWQLEPEAGGRVRRQSAVFSLSARGAGILASRLHVPAKPVIRRAWSAFHYPMRIHHDLEVNGFFADLIAGSRPLPDQGLYHWLGDESLRRTFQQRKAEEKRDDKDKQVMDLAPDGWGRYLAADTEIAFNVEWDKATESQQHLVEKGRAHVAYYPNPGLSQVLWIGPTPSREYTIRTALARTLPSNERGPRFWTTNGEVVRESGALEPVWQAVGSEGRRQRLADLPGRPRQYHRLEDCLGKPEWWMRRPGGSEGS